ncbi:MAG TPA: class I SAM-dependent methyltransferase [Nocardioides sp.]|jgi:release factor glutamine methyltransferase|nr:class I SAM-dependent methyltransferase [Nocardioides sp.]
MTGSTTATMDFGGLSITYDERVLRPRPWTVAQSRWAAELLAELPDGPVLELCSGAGQIGLAAVARAGRDLVCVDLNPAAVELARLNAEAAGLRRRVTVREGRLAEAVREGEHFPLVIADPPWVETSRTGRYPEDPLEAIDGGHDGLTVACECLAVIEAHLSDDGAALLQLGSVDQVAALMSLGSGSLRALEVRRYDGGAVAHLARSDRD